MKIFDAICLLTVICLMAGCNGNGTEPEPEDFALSLQPQENTISQGNNKTISLNITSVEDMFLITIDLSYDTSVVQVDSINIPENSIFTDDAISYYDRVTAGVSLGVGNIQTAGDDDVSGSGTLLDIYFTGIGTGTTDVSIDSVMILDEAGDINSDLANLLIIDANVTVE